MAKVTVVKASQFSARVVDTRRYATARLGEGPLDRACDCRGRTGCKSRAGCDEAGCKGRAGCDEASDTQHASAALRSRGPVVTTRRFGTNGLDRIQPIARMLTPRVKASVLQGRGIRTVRPLGGVECEIPSWVADCVNEAIRRFNDDYPPIVVSAADYGSVAGTPPEVLEEERRLTRFIGSSGFLAYTDSCSPATRGQLRGILAVAGGASWVAAATGETFPSTWRSPRPGGLPDEENYESVLTAGLFPLPGVYLSSAGCSLLSRPIGRLGQRQAPDWRQVRKWGFPGGLGGLVCIDREAWDEEIETLRAAYIYAQTVAPSMEYEWADERLMADRAFVDAFYSAPDVMWIIDRVTGLGGFTFPDFYFGIWRDASAPNNSYGLQDAVDFADTIAGNGRQRRLRLRVCR